MITYALPFGICVQTQASSAPGAGRGSAIRSRLKEHIPAAQADAIESFLLALGAEGADLSDPCFRKALETTVEACTAR